MELFVEKYFGKDAEYYWIADEVGGCLYVNDRFFNINDIVNFIRYRYTPDQMFEYYDKELESKEKGQDYFPNIKNWKKLNENKVSNRKR